MADEKDIEIGRNLARLRGDLTQAELGEAMRARGWKWSQATVWSIEKGERPLRLAEAIDLAGILRLTVEDFAMRTWETTLGEMSTQVLDAEGEISRAIETHHMALDALLEVLRVAREREVDEPGATQAMELAEAMAADARLSRILRAMRKTRFAQRTFDWVDGEDDPDGKHPEAD